MDISELKRQQTSPINRHPWELARARVVCFLIKHPAKSFEKTVDIGSGDAFLINDLISRSVAQEAIAIDSAYDNELIQQMSATYPSSILFTDSYLNGHLKDYHPNLLLLLDVLEHCKNDGDELKNILAHVRLHDNSTILITVPAFQSLFSGHDQLLGHYRRYNRNSIQSLCRNEGLTVIRSGYFFFSLAIIRFFEKRFHEDIGRDKSVDNWNHGYALTRLISAILWVDFRISYLLSSVGLHLPGLSCYCLCKRSR